MVGDFLSLRRSGQSRKFFRQSVTRQENENIRDAFRQRQILSAEIRVNFADAGVAGGAGGHHVIHRPPGESDAVEFGQLLHRLLRPGTHRRQAATALILGDNHRNADKFQRRQQRLADGGVHVVDAAAGEKSDRRFTFAPFDHLRHPVAKRFAGNGRQGAVALQKGCRKAQAQAAVLRQLLEQQRGELAAGLGQKIHQLGAPQHRGHALAETRQAFLLGDAATRRRNDLIGGHLVGALGTAAAAQQALAHVLEHFLLKVDLAVEHRPGQRHLAARHPPFMLLRAEHRAVGTAGAAFNALFDLFTEVFELFHLRHIFYVPLRR